MPQPTKDYKYLRKILFITFILAIGVFFFDFLCRLDINSIALSIKKIAFTTLIYSAICIFIASVVMQSLYFWLYFEGKLNALSKFISIFYSTVQIQLYFLFSPPGGTALVRMYKFRKLGYKTESVVTVVVLYRITSLLMFLCIGLMFILNSPVEDFFIAKLSFKELLLASLLSTTLGFFILYLVRKSHILYNRILEYSSIITRMFISSPMKLQLACISILLANLFGSLAYSFIFDAIDFEISFLDIYLLRGFVMMVQVLPISFMGIGLREVSLATILPIYGLSDEMTVVAILLILFLQIFLAIAGGVFEVAALKKYLLRRTF